MPMPIHTGEERGSRTREVTSHSPTPLTSNIRTPLRRLHRSLTPLLVAALGRLLPLQLGPVSQAQGQTRPGPTATRRQAAVTRQRRRLLSRVIPEPARAPLFSSGSRRRRPPRGVMEEGWMGRAGLLSQCWVLGYDGGWCCSVSDMLGRQTETRPLTVRREGAKSSRQHAMMGGG